MPYDTNGNYSLPTIYYAISGTVINPSQHNTPFEDVQAALNRPLLRDGTAPMSGDLNANNHKVTNLPNGTSDSDAVNYGQLKNALNNPTFSGEVSVPAVTDWAAYQAIGAKDADARYVQKASGANDYPALSAGVQKSSGSPWFSYVDAAGTTQWTFFQPAGDYATNKALSTEASSRASADTNLQDQVNNRVLKDGDTMNGSLIVNSFSGITAEATPGTANNGDYINYPAFISSSAGRGGHAFMQVQEHVGDSFSFLAAVANGSSSRYLRMGLGSSRINDSSFGDLAYTSDLPFSDKSLRWFVVRENVSKSNGGRSSHTFPSAFAAGSVPYVIPVGSREGNNGNSSLPIIDIDSNGNLAISNTGMTLYWTTGTGNSNLNAWLTYMVGGYF
ncbi:hypothetical protein [Acetobacter cerevisiae]|uniref:hypothetical protein n=1 Tax=Acetobacter cerevisiae TaxID=178900 RepID=UPI00209D5322|nr:hypothetical protein [Acetobacter cerevisiae]MCP1270575.1 hypothetical protein [Acetobacter cerevisiae]MCP1278529.1 hypothetical protein [Acetobacter cerevisiae]